MTYDSPVHWLENVDGDPSRFRIACRSIEWAGRPNLLDPDREAVYPVTCQKCLATMADKPVIVETT